MYVPSPNTVQRISGNPFEGPGIGCGACGLGLLDGTGLFGTNLFASSDITTWGMGEALVGAFGLFVLYSVFSTSSRGYKKVRGKVRYIAGAGERARQEKAAKLREEARRLEGPPTRKRKTSGGLF